MLKTCKYRGRHNQKQGRNRGCRQTKSQTTHGVSNIYSKPANIGADTVRNRADRNIIGASRVRNRGCRSRKKSEKNLRATYEKSKHVGHAC